MRHGHLGTKPIARIHDKMVKLFEERGWIEIFKVAPTSDYKAMDRAIRWQNTPRSTSLTGNSCCATPGRTTQHLADPLHTLTGSLCSTTLALSTNRKCFR
eukprot:m.263616 g.263616  ORF g.263616 m.263616 type:complete len:100 (+) comp51293_c0_seq1:61-360(+)